MTAEVESYTVNKKLDVRSDRPMKRLGKDGQVLARLSVTMAIVVAMVTSHPVSTTLEKV